MTDESFPRRPIVNVEHESLQGAGASDTAGSRMWSFDQLQDNNLTNNTDVSDGINRQQNLTTNDQLNYQQFSPGFSDDEGNGEGFERSWPSHQIRKQAASNAKGKKSPRRSDSGSEGSETGKHAKKPRQSLFGGEIQRIEHEEQDDVVQMPATPGHNIGHSLSSMNLDQEQDGDDMMGAVNTGFGLASSDIGSVRNSPALSDDDFFNLPDTVPSYDLRQNIDRKKAVTHVDNDNSGNWDPDQELKERTAKLIRARAAKKEKKEKQAQKKRKGKNDVSRDYVIKCIAKLPFDSFGNVRNITNDEQNWPENWSEVDSEQERELKEWRVHYRSNSPNRGLQLPLEDPAGKTDDLTGHPAARGCMQCRTFEQACSLIHGGRYPCEECIEGENECELIQEPTMKDRCKQCDQTNEEICSFENDPTQPSCDHCTISGQVCEALPPRGYKAQRLNVDEIVWGPDRPFITCTACRKLKKRCSLKTKQDKPPCKPCKKSGDACRFVDPPQSENETQIANGETVLERIAPNVTRPNSGFFTEEDLANMHHRSTAVVEREPTPDIEMEDAEGNKGMLTKITTSFAHPIKFSVEKSDMTDCNFCEIPIFGMFGHFERQVHVIRWYSGLGFAEVGGGHAQNEGATAMCSDCTNKRLQIMVCPGHEFQRIPYASSDHDALVEELTEVEPGGVGMQYQLSKWCSMCFSPAVFGCSSLQADLCGEEETQIEGCHLRLCFACEVALRTRYEGSLDAMAAEYDSQPKIAEADETLGRQIEGRPRADVGLLMQDGLLMRVVQADG